MFDKPMIKLSTFIQFIVVFIVFFALLILPIFNFHNKAYSDTSPTISEFPIHGALWGIAAGSDGNIWAATIDSTANIYRISPNGNLINQYSVPANINYAMGPGMTSGPDGNVWFTERGANKIGRITGDGITTEFTIPSDNTFPMYITSGPDGNLWFTEQLGYRIGRITPAGIISEFTLPFNNNPSYGGNTLYGITSGPDGNIWFTEYGAGKIGRITTNGTVTEFAVATNPNSLGEITSGLDRNLWFTDASNNKIGKITPNGEIAEFSIPTINSSPQGIITGPDGNIWFTEFNGMKIGKITPEGDITEYQVLTNKPLDIVLGLDNNLWFTQENTNNIGRINLSNLPSPTPTVTPTPIPTPTVDFKQTNPSWSTLPILPANYLTHLDHSLSCGDMYGFGCAVTSIADVFYSYGKTFLTNSLTQLTPGSLNNWLSENNGFSSCSAIWGNASTSTKLGAPIIIFRNSDSTWNKGQQAIDSALNNGDLPIVGIITSFGTHFIALSKKLPDINRKPDYSIIDPALYPFIANSFGNTGKSLNQAYGGFDKVFETVIYKNGSLPQKTLTIRGHSPIQLLVTDPQGIQTGYDKTTGNINENISQSSYGIEPGIAPVDGESPAAGETKYFQQINPSDGNYKVELIGTGDGTYSLDFSTTTDQGSVSTATIQGVAKTGVTDTYDIKYISNTATPPVVNKIVTFQSVIDDVNDLYSLNLITQKSVANNLIRNIEQAQKASVAGDNSKMVQNINQFIDILQRERGRKLTERAYQILNSDANSLISKLRGY